jgi:hypothetical protein
VTEPETGKTGTDKTETDQSEVDQPETEPEPAAVLGSVLEGARLDDPSLRVALLKVDVKPAWLASGGALFVDLPRRLSCAACEGGGCSRCKNSGGFRLADAQDRAPLRVEIAKTNRDVMRIRVPLDDDDDVDVVLLELASTDAPSSFVRYQGRHAQIARAAPSANITPVGIISTAIGLFALVLTIVLALLMRS